MPAAHLHFSHEKHLGMEGVTCATCHARVADEKVATREDLPSMETCLGCHGGVKAPNECRTCHLAGPGGTIRTSFASGTLVPDDHGVHWLKEHSAAAERDMGLCASCHAQSDCLSCHDGSVPPAFHESNYLMIHPSDAMANNPPCASCHRVDRFCRDCHLRSDVTLGGSMTTGEFHPMGWLTPGDPNHHSNVAKKNLEQCTACHAQEDCIACHAFYQGAPRTHPAGWRDSEQMRLLRSANFALCLRCHGMGEPGDPIP